MSFIEVGLAGNSGFVCIQLPTRQTVIALRDQTP
jgi:hypothetical protein